jgi:hypothetical protein
MQSVPFVTFVIKGTPVQLDLHIYRDQYDKVFSSIKLPATYPDTTQLGTRYKERTIFVFSLTLHAKNKVEQHWLPARHVRLLRQYMPAASDFWFINEFYFYPKTANIPLTAEEQSVFGGLGKRAAAVVLRHLILTVSSIDMGRTVVCLEASGAVRSRSAQNERERELEQASLEDLHHLVETKYNLLAVPDFYVAAAKKFKTGLWKKMCKSDLLDHVLAPIMYAEDNILLAQYYTRNFGLDIIDDTHKTSQICMAAPLDRMINLLGV